MRTGKAVSWAANLADEFGANLTLAHVTAGVALWGPGGLYIDAELKTPLYNEAFRRLAELKMEMGSVRKRLLPTAMSPRSSAKPRSRYAPT
jgi:hypothetical protein